MDDYLSPRKREAVTCSACRDESNAYMRDYLLRDASARRGLSFQNTLNKALKGKAKMSRRMRKIVGCDLETLRNLFENQFEDGMRWELYGRGRGSWQLDHILPRCSFDCSTEKGLRSAFHHGNLQPLWTKDNLQATARDRSLRRLRAGGGKCPS